MKYLRILESLIKKVNSIPKYSSNEKLKKTFRSANYNISNEKKFIFSDHEEIKYILKNNEEISKRVFIDGQFDFPILKKGLKYLKKKKRNFLISIGSHVGTTLIPAIKNNLFEYCIAFEPAADNFRLLTANVNINKIEKKVKLFNIALGNKISNGYLKLFDRNNSGDYRVVKKLKNSEKININILDNFTSHINQRNSLIFIDAQGHEPEILLGGRKTLKKKIPLIFELTPDIMKKNSFKILFNILKHYTNLTDLKENKILKMNKINFFKLYQKYKKNKSHTDVMVF